MKNKTSDCILALDLGTTAFKCAAVYDKGIIGTPVVMRYRLDYDCGRVTCPASRYERTMWGALREAASKAKRAGFRVSAIGIGSQAQTFLELDRQGHAVNPAVVWTDARAADGARKTARGIPGFARHSGFAKPSPMQFLPKVMHALAHEKAAARNVARFLLLNEFAVYRLTGRAYGDEVNQGMGGFYDISRRRLSTAALRLAGITPAHLAEIHPAGAYAALTTPAATRRIGVPAPIPVFSCGNDQSCGAAGAGLRGPSDILCNFGTAMVIYTIHERIPRHLTDDQIAGIDPLTGRFFTLGVISECGNVMDWAHNTFCPEMSMDAMIKAAAGRRDAPDTLPALVLRGNGRFDITGVALSHDRLAIVAALLHHYAKALDGMRKQLTKGAIRRAVASGGLSRSADWRAFFRRYTGLAMTPAPSPHIGLLGIRAILARQNSNRISAII